MGRQLVFVFICLMSSGLAHPAARLLIHHDGFDEGISRAEESRASLIALAVDSKRIELNTDIDSRGLNLELVGITVEK